MQACYIRPILYRGYETLGVNPLTCPVDAAILLWEWGAYLGQEALEQGVDVRIASWSRMAPNTLPAMAKSSANYANSGLIKMEALADGYSEGIALDVHGNVSEGSGQNIFMVRDQVVYTPPIASSILGGITRDSIITLARDLGYTVTETGLPRESLYTADEVFFVGTAAEVTPIRSIDKITIGSGRRGPVTERIQRAFFDVINGVIPDRHGWLTYVHVDEPPTTTANAARPARLPMHVNDLLKVAVENGASDLHLKVGSYPMMRVRGSLSAASQDKKLDHEDLVAMSAAVMSTSQRQKFKESQEVDLAYSVPGLGRFRCNIFQQRGTVGLVLRVIPMQIRTVEELGLPTVLKSIAAEERGLVLVTGTTGSGKSTTLAAMIDEINRTRSAHVMTVEDPIEFLHRDDRSMINQREVAVDTRSFAQALRSALRQDPDVILVGEMRDYETIETGLLAAETGHLVFSTLHTLDATETINRIIAVFPPHQQKQIRLQLASVLRAVISQRLMPRVDGKGRVAGGRGDDQHALRPRLHRRQGKDASHPRRHRRRHLPVRDADLRPVDLRPVRAGAGRLRGGAALGQQQGRVQAASPGHRDHIGSQPRRDGQRRARRAGNYEVWRLTRPTSTDSSSSPAASCPRRKFVSGCPDAIRRIWSTRRSLA